VAATKPPTLASRVAGLLPLASGNLLRRPTPAPSSTPMSKIGVPAAPIDRNRAQVPQPAAQTGKGDLRQAAYVYFTKVPAVGAATPVLYSADRLWAKVTVTLETAGPVAVGFNSSLTPLTSGKGILLTTDAPVTFDVAKGNKLYIQAAGVNRVNVQVQSYPWLEQITGLLMNLVNTVLGAMGVTP